MSIEYNIKETDEHLSSHTGLELVGVLIEKSLDQVSDNAIKILEIAGSLSFALFNKKLIQYAIPENLLIIIRSILMNL